MSEPMRLIAERGKKFDETGEAIGSYNRSIVFLPCGAVPGQEVRVILDEVASKKDTRGNTMYRGRPAPDLPGERWRDNGNGTLSRVATMTNWLGTVREVGMIETRKPETREQWTSTRTNRKVTLGTTLADCAVEVTEGKVFTTEVEQVIGASENNPRLAWVKVSDRVEESTRTIGVKSGWFTSLDSTMWQPVYPSDWELRATVKDVESAETAISLKWQKCPAEMKRDLESRYPVCACGQKRYDFSKSPLYAGCDQCQVKEHCARCAQQGKVEHHPVSRSLVCEKCKPYEDMESLINEHVPCQKRVKFAKLASQLLAGNAVEREVGEIILRSTLGHVESESRRDDLMRNHTGYAWYYFCDEGVFGSKFSPVALQILRHIDRAAGNGLVESIAWIAGRYQKVEDCERWGDFYWKTQVQGASVAPSLSQHSFDNIAIATQLRGSEADRIAALEEYQALSKRLGADSEQAQKVHEILMGNDQDYARARMEMRSLRKLLEQMDEGTILINFGGHYRVMGSTDNANFWVLDPHGFPRNPDLVEDRRGYAGCDGKKTWRLLQPEELAISWSKSCTAADHHFVVNKLPVGGCTEAQLEAVEGIEDEMEKRWEDRTGMSGTSSPGIGVGWNLDPEPLPGVAPDDQVVQEPASLNALEALRRKFQRI